MVFRWVLQLLSTADAASPDGRHLIAGPGPDGAYCDMADIRTADAALSESSTSAERHRSLGSRRAPSRRHCWCDIRWPLSAWHPLTASGRCPLSAQHPLASWHPDWTELTDPNSLHLMAYPVTDFSTSPGTPNWQIWQTSNIHGGLWMIDFEQWKLKQLRDNYLALNNCLFINLVCVLLR